MHVRQIEFATPEYDEAVQLRTLVLRRPLGMEYDPEQLAQEYDHIHLAAFNNSGRLVGCLILTPLDEQVVKMRQVAVAPYLQRSGIGKALVLYAEDLAREKQFAKMVLHARDTACPFYDALDYSTVGEPFEEVTIRHFKMEKHL